MLIASSHRALSHLEFTNDTEYFYIVHCWGPNKMKTFNRQLILTAHSNPILLFIKAPNRKFSKF